MGGASGEAEVLKRLVSELVSLTADLAWDFEILHTNTNSFPQQSQIQSSHT